MCQPLKAADGIVVDGLKNTTRPQNPVLCPSFHVFLHPQALVANVDYDDFKGKLGVGRIHSGMLRKGQTVGIGRPGGNVKPGKISELFVFDNLGRAVRAPRFANPGKR